MSVDSCDFSIVDDPNGQLVYYDEIAPVVDALRARIAALEARAEGAEAERDTARLALESLTPGGSEFVGDAAYCVEYVRARLDAAHETNKRLMKRAQAAEGYLAGLTARAEAAEGERDVAVARVDEAEQGARLMVIMPRQDRLCASPYDRGRDDAARAILWKLCGEIADPIFDANETDPIPK